MKKVKFINIFSKNKFKIIKEANKRKDVYNL